MTFSVRSSGFTKISHLSSRMSRLMLGQQQKGCGYLIAYGKVNVKHFSSVLCNCKSYDVSASPHPRTTAHGELD